MMATLSYLEDREEATRAVHSGLKKRWEARRELVGRPKPAKHSIKQVVHAHPGISGLTDLVVFDHSRVLEEHRMRQREVARVAKCTAPKKNPKMAIKQQKPIQQPRKHI
mmetsp:Transcript_21928/g.35283  ORF Transcript_21928/g.35283 Transcript_21928/m.35283 type:complete len:109 (+) Transcript_21928:1-327(+)